MSSKALNKNSLSTKKGQESKETDTLSGGAMSDFYLQLYLMECTLIIYVVHISIVCSLEMIWWIFYEKINIFVND